MIEQKEYRDTQSLNLNYLLKNLISNENIKELKKEVIDYIYNLEYDPTND